MALVSTTNVSRHDGNGVSTVFGYTFKIFEEGDIAVYVDGELQTITTDYTVSGVGDTNGGDITFLVAPPVGGDNVVLRRTVAITQESEYPEGTKFPTQQITNDLDKRAMVEQQLDETFGRTLVAPVTELPLALLPPLTERANKYLAFDSGGDPIVVDAATPSGTSVTATGTTQARLLADRFAQERWIEDFAPTGTADDSATIQLALDTVGAEGGGNLRCKRDTYTYATKLTHRYNNVTLIGCGAGGSRQGTGDPDTASTIFRWVGAPGDIMYEMAPTPLSANRVVGGGIIGIFFDGQTVAGTGVLVQSVEKAKFNLTINETSVVGLDLNCDETLTNDPSDTQSNWFEQIMVIQQDPASGICVRLDGGTSSNTSLNHFGHMRLFRYDSLALELINCDGNLFDIINVYNNPAGSGYSVAFRGGVGGFNCRRNTFGHFEAGSGSLLSEGTSGGKTAALGNVILDYSLGNGGTLPTVEFGSGLSYQSNNGQVRASRNGSSFPYFETHFGTKTAAVIAGKFQFTAYNDADEEIIYAQTQMRILDPTAASEDGEIRIFTYVAGTNVNQGQIANGWCVGTSPTGGMLGTGTLNAATNVYKAGAAIAGREVVTYSANMTIDQRLGAFHEITVTDASNFTIGEPINSNSGDLIWIMVRNASGGAMGTITLGAGAYAVSAAFPKGATGFCRTVCFYHLGASFVEVFRTAADVPNT